jgi:chromosome segregation ATPase
MTTDDEKLRAEISAQVFAGEPAATAPEAAQAPELKSEPEPAKAEPAEEAPVDEWAGASPALRKTVEALQEKVGIVDSLQFRLKQAEQRLGAATSELSELKKKPEAVKEAPPASEKWQKFNADYTEISEPIEERIAAIRAEVLDRVPTIDEKGLAETIAETVKMEIAAERLEEIHPGWKERIETPEFKGWRKTAPEFQQQATTFTAAKRMLDAFTDFKKTQKSPADIEAARLKRLEQAQTTEGRKLPAVKSEADMTPAELRAHIAGQVFGKA